MKRFPLLVASLILSAQMIGCGEGAAPPAGTPGTGPDTGPSTTGEAKKDRDKMFADMEERAAKVREKGAKKK
jgi:hypothetical protein